MFPALLLAMVLVFLLSWPIEWSLDLWVFKDRGSFLNLDYLLDQHLRLGVDTYYSYGLLPVLVQRLMFVMFGRGPWSLLPVHAAYVLLMALIWTCLLQSIADRPAWARAAVVLVPIMVWVNPNLPYVLVQLSLLGSLALLLRGRADYALAVAVIGCFSVPSLPLLYCGSLALWIAFDAWRGRKGLAFFVRQVAPGVLTFLLTGLLLAGFFGFQPVLATALPTQGSAHYQAVGYGVLTSLGTFLFPGRDTVLHGSLLRYYLFDRATWWMLSTALLTVLAGYAAYLLLSESRARTARTATTLAAVVLCALVQLAFALVAYGPPGQHVIYDPVLLAGTLVGLGTLPIGRLRTALAWTCVCCGFLGGISQAAYTYAQWRDTRPTETAYHFYAPPGFSRDWAPIARVARTQRVLLLAYSTGIHHYFTNIDSPDAWTMNLAQLFPGDHERLLEKIRRARFVAEDLTSPNRLFETDPQFRAALARLCPLAANGSFLLWSVPPRGSDGREDGHSCEKSNSEADTVL